MTSEYSARNTGPGAMVGSIVEDVPVDAIAPNPRNPRRHFDEAALAELGESIRVNGLLEPIVVRRVGEDRYELIAGERRWRASRLIGAETIRASVTRSLDDATALRLTLIENLQRQDLDPIEEAEGYRLLNEVVGLRQTEIAVAVGRSQPRIANKLRLLGLPEAVRSLVSKGRDDGGLSEAHGIALARWSEYPDVVARMAEMAADAGWSSKDLEKGIPGATTLAQEGLIVQIESPYFAGFDAEVCNTCPFGAMRKANDWARYCFKPEHYRQLKREAEEAREAEREAERARTREQVRAGDQVAAAVRAASEDPGAVEVGEQAPAYPELSRLRDYVNLSNRQQAAMGCGEDCPCRGLGRDSRGQLVSICTDPVRYAKLERAQTVELNRRRRAAAKRLIALVETKIDGLIVEPGPNWDLVAPLLVAASFYDYQHMSPTPAGDDRLELGRQRYMPTVQAPEGSNWASWRSFKSATALDLMTVAPTYQLVQTALYGRLTKRLGAWAMAGDVARVPDDVVAFLGAEAVRGVVVAVREEAGARLSAKTKGKSKPLIEALADAEPGDGEVAKDEAAGEVEVELPHGWALGEADGETELFAYERRAGEFTARVALIADEAGGWDASLFHRDGRSSSHDSRFDDLLLAMASCDHYLDHVPEEPAEGEAGAMCGECGRVVSAHYAEHNWPAADFCAVCASEQSVAEQERHDSAISEAEERLAAGDVVAAPIEAESEPVELPELPVGVMSLERAISVLEAHDSGEAQTIEDLTEALVITKQIPARDGGESDRAFQRRVLAALTERANAPRSAESEAGAAPKRKRGRPSNAERAARQATIEAGSL